MPRFTQLPLLLMSPMRGGPRPPELDHAIDEVLAQREPGVPPTDDLLRALRRAGGNPLCIVEMLRPIAQAGDASSSHAPLTRGE